MPKTNRKRITKMTLEQRAPAAGRIDIRDTDSPLIFRIASTGHKGFSVRIRVGHAGHPLRFTYPKLAVLANLPDARNWARETVDACLMGLDPRQAKQQAEAAAALATGRSERLKCKNVIADYLDRRVRREKQNRTADEIARMFAVYVTPRWGDRLVTEIDRKDVNDLLNDVFDRHIHFEGRTYGGNVAADRLLAQLSACFRWYQLQDSKFTSPVVPGMARTSPRARKRTRALSDEEIRVMWSILPDHGTFGAIVKALLLSAQRLREVGEMGRSEILPGDMWTIPAARYKTNMANVVPMSATLREVIEAQPVLTLDGKNCDYVFTTNAETPFSGFSKCKDRLDAGMLAALRKTATERGEDPAKVTLPDWRLHDLRRTAKTLMARAGVRPDISERVLGHVIPGVEGTYDQHDYVAEKRAALEALATMIKHILAGPADNVVQLREAAE
jgi:integrase